MRAAWYEKTGPASKVLVVGELPDPTPGPGEVLVRVRYSGVNPGDAKKREGWQGGPMPYPRVIPHSDASGVIDAVGAGVDAARVGRRVWVHGAQSYRPFGTAAEYVVVPGDLAVDLPDGVPDTLGACLGIPGITAHRAVFADGPVDGLTVLVQGVHGAVGRLAAQLARRAGARVIGTIRKRQDFLDVESGTADHVVVLGSEAHERIAKLAPDGVHRIIEVAFAANLKLDAAVAAPGATIAAYGTDDPKPRLPFWPMLFDNLVIRLLGSDDFPVEAKRAAAADLTAAASEGALPTPIRKPLRLARIAKAHDLVESGIRARVLIDPTA